MTAEAAIAFLLNNNIALAGLVGDCVYPVVIPEGVEASCSVVYASVSDNPMATIDGRSDFSLRKARVQVTAAAPTYPGLKQLKEAIIAACHKQSGPLGGVQVSSCVFSLAGPDDYDSAVERFTQPIDFILMYQ